MTAHDISFEVGHVYLVSGVAGQQNKSPYLIGLMRESHGFHRLGFVLSQKLIPKNLSFQVHLKYCKLLDSFRFDSII